MAIVVLVFASLPTLTPDELPPLLPESPSESPVDSTPLTGLLKTMETVLMLDQQGIFALVNCPAPLASS